MSAQPRAAMRESEARTPRAARQLVMGLGAAAGALVIIGLPSVSQAATPGTTTFTFSGHVSGVLQMADGACGGTGGQFEFRGKALKGSEASTWTVNVNSPSTTGGTWTRFNPSPLGSAKASVVLQGWLSDKVYDWTTESGRITTSRSGGTVDVTLVPEHSFSGIPGSGTIHLNGSWGCASD